jgi:hypothetical protein
VDKLLDHKWNWIQHVNRMPRNRLPRVLKHYSPTSRRNHGRPLKRLLDSWDRNGSTSSPTPWRTYDDDDSMSAMVYVIGLYYNELCYVGFWYSAPCCVVQRGILSYTQMFITV